ncbi:hypothetical protein IIA79_05455 [bacterium]|nr:hypothetical protein [bacterium]
MKKLIFVFVALLMLVLVSGCGARQNTVRFDDDGNSEGETVSTEDAEESEGKMAKDSIQPKGKLAVTSFDGAFFKSNLSYNVVRGTVPTNTQTIKVNDYKLQKYFPGQTQWSYIAATRFGTLKDGLNNYVIKTFDRSGEQNGSIMFSIDYEAPVIPSQLPGVGASHWLALLASMIIGGMYTIFRKHRWL